MPRFEGEEFQNIHWWDNDRELTEDYKAKALEMVYKHDLHKCAVAVNRCKKDISDTCRRGCSRMETINETSVDELTDRVLYQHVISHLDMYRTNVLVYHTMVRSARQTKVTC